METWSISDVNARARRRMACVFWGCSLVVLAISGHCIELMGTSVQESAVVKTVEWSVVLAVGIVSVACFLLGIRLACVPKVDVNNGTVAVRPSFIRRQTALSRIDTEQSLAKTVALPRPRRYLVLADRAGRCLLKVPHAVLLADGGDILAKRLFSVVDGPSVLDIFHVPDSRRGAKTRGRVTFACIMVFLLISVAAGILGVEAWGTRYLQKRGRKVAGVVIGRGMAESREAYVRYTFTTEDGKGFVREARMRERAAAGMNPGKQVTVRYMITYPDFNRLEGEYDTAVFPLLVCVAGLLVLIIAALICHLARVDACFSHGHIRLLPTLDTVGKTASVKGEKITERL